MANKIESKRHSLKVYLAHPIATKGEFEDSKRVAEEIRKLGYEVYAAADNDAINDKSNDILAYTSNARLLQTQYYKGVTSASANHLILGMIDKWGEFSGDERAMLETLNYWKEDKEDVTEF